VRKEKEPKVVNFRDSMNAGDWGIGTFQRGVNLPPEKVLAQRRANGFSLFIGEDFAVRYLGSFVSGLVITEILPPGTQVVITL
jgi:hypothetical protein